MFVIKLKDPSDWQDALFMLSYYNVSMTTYSDGDNATSSYMVVGGEGCGQQVDEDDLRLAEMAFQMNWHQKGWVCPHCDDGDSEATCGHLTFNRPINPAF